eukprot:scaffold10016_cov170-Amphora_coffeaeformis.AAC.1
MNVESTPDIVLRKTVPFTHDDRLHEIPCGKKATLLGITTHEEQCTERPHAKGSDYSQIDSSRKIPRIGVENGLYRHPSLEL